MSSENLPQMQQEFLDMRASNYFSMIKLLAKHEPELIKQQVNSYGKNNVSFFVSFLLDIQSNKAQEGDEQLRKDFLEFCESYGYKLNNNTYKHNSSTYIYGKLQNPDQKTLPDFLHVLTVRGSDELLLTMTEKLGKDYFLNLEKDWNFLPYVYKAGFSKTVRKLTEYGLTNNSDILTHIEYENEMVNLYWEMVKLNKEQKNDIGNNEQDLEASSVDEDIKWLNKKINYSLSYTKNGQSDSIKSYLKSRFPRLSQDSKERIMLELTTSKDLTVLNAGLKLLSTNLKKYSSENYPIWTNLAQIQSQNILYAILDKNFDLTTYDSKSDKYYAIELLKSLKKLDVDQNVGKTTNRSSNKAVRDSSIMEKIKEIFPHDFWLQQVPNKNHNWFIEALKHEDINSNYIIWSIKNNVIEGRHIWHEMNTQERDQFAPLTVEQLVGVQEFFSKTLFSKDDNGITLVAAKPIELLNENFLINGLENNVFSNENKESMLSALINIKNIAYSTSSSNCKILYEYLAKDPTIVWSNIKVKTENIESLSNFPLYFEIKARTLLETLNKVVPNKEEIAVKKKKI